MKARLAVIAAGAFLAFAIVLLLMRALDRVGARPRVKPEAKAKAQDEAEAPRLRRADAHPDAPSRRPLLAGRDLGDFIEPDEYDDFDELEEPETFADLPAQPLPGFLMPEQAQAAPAPLEPEPVRPVLSDPEPVVEPESEYRPVFESEHEPLELTQEANGFDELVSQLPEVGETRDGESIADLMRRLETGLSQREQTAADEQAPREIAAGSPEAPSPAEAFEPQPVAAEPEISFPHAFRSAAEEEPPMVERAIAFLQPDEPVAETPAEPDISLQRAEEPETSEAPTAAEPEVAFSHSDEFGAEEEPVAAAPDISFLHAGEPEAEDEAFEADEFEEAEESFAEEEEIPFRHSREPESGDGEGREIPFHRMTELAARKPAREPDFPYSREPDLSSFPHMREPRFSKPYVPLNGSEPEAGEMEPEVAPPAEAHLEEPAPVVAEQPRPEPVPQPRPEAEIAAEEPEAFEPGPATEEAEAEGDDWDEPQSLYPPAPLPAPEPDYPPIEQQVGHRLRAAIGGLNRAAGRN